jgi:uncharacterized iron-regulated membrane protein
MSPSGGGAMYARLWRWHFFAALLVVPFILWQSITGTLYLWHRELAMESQAQLLTVTPQAERASYEAQLQAALKGQPAGSLPQVVLEADRHRSTMFLFTASNGLSYPTFVDPYTGQVLGTVAPARWLGGWSRSLHGGWPLGSWGSNLLEIGAGWTIVMILTGLYLWWPRNARGLAGVLYPRLNEGSRLFWRDLHATVGVWFAVIVLMFLVTALPWTAFWGDRLLGAIQTSTHQHSPAATFFSGGGHHHSGGGTTPATRAPLDRFIGAARDAGAVGRLEIRLEGEGAVQVRSQTGRSPQDVYVELDRATAAVIRREGWDETTWVPKLVSLGVDLHQGTFFGRANQLFNTLVAAALVWLAVTGFIGWLKRRPAGELAAPPRRNAVLTSGVKLVGVAACVLMPLFGLSVVVVGLVDWAARASLKLSRQR